MDNRAAGESQSPPKNLQNKQYNIQHNNQIAHAN